MGNSTEKICSLVDSVDSGKLLVPEMQRRYVWRSTQVRDLFDSLYRGYPVGSILVWNRPDGDVEGRVMDVGESAGKLKGGQTLLLLDGQQRLTSLTSILKDKELLVRWRKKSIDILFNVTHPDVEGDEVLDVVEPDDDDDDDVDNDNGNDALDFEKKTFVVATRRLVSQPNWISLRRIFRDGAADIWLDVIDKMNLEPKSQEAKKILGRIQQLQKIADIEIPIVTLGKEMNYRTVTDVFCRVNSAGARLKGSDLALAQITSRWVGSLKKFESFQNKWGGEAKQPLFDLGFLIRALVVFCTGQCKFLSVGAIPVDCLEKGWSDTKKALETAFDIIKNGWQINSFSLLSAPSLVITVAYYLKHLEDSSREFSKQEMAKLHQWLLVASICGHYSKGSSESIMDQDLAAIDKGVTLDEMMLTFAKQGWAGSVTEDDLKGKFHGSAYFGLMYLAMRDAGAKDWCHHTKISLANVGSVLKVQFHHICPRARLKAHGGYDAAEINDIANLAFLGGSANRKISDKNPAEYLPNISVEDRKVQCVPLDEALYNLDNYRAFISERRRLIAQMLNGYLVKILVS